MKVQLIPANQSELRHLINFAYDGDTDLIEKYQAGDRTFEECVDFNCDEIIQKMSDPVFAGDMRIWKIMLQVGDEVGDIGYCVTVENEMAPHWLYSFAVNIKYRKREILQQWLSEIEKHIGQTYYAALWNVNTRAISFFSKNGFTAKKRKEDIFTYLFKGYDLISKKELSTWQLV